MAKKARVNPTKQPALAKIAKKTGRSSGKLVMGLYGQMVTPKVLEAQKTNQSKRKK